MFKFQVKFDWNMFLILQLMVCQYWFRWLLVIECSGIKPLPESVSYKQNIQLCMVLLGFNELTVCGRMTCILSWIRVSIIKWLLSAQFLYPPLNEGILVSKCPSVDRIVSALYHLQYLADPFYIYTSYQTISEGVSHVKFFLKLK